MKPDRKDPNHVGQILQQPLAEIEKAILLQQEMAQHLATQLTTLHKVLHAIAFSMLVILLFLLIAVGYLLWS